MTNFERIKSMSTQELAIWLAYVRANVSITGNRSVGQPAVDKNIAWLNKEVVVEDNSAVAHWIECHPPESYSLVKHYECSNCGALSMFKYERCLRCGRAMQNGECEIRGL